MTNPITQSLKITICESADDAVAKGYDWNKVTPEVKPIEVKEVVVVRNGMVSGAATVDFLLEDATGQRFVFMITGNLLKSIPC